MLSSFISVFPNIYPLHGFCYPLSFLIKLQSSCRLLQIINRWIIQTFHPCQLCSNILRGIIDKHLSPIFKLQRRTDNYIHWGGQSAIHNERTYNWSSYQGTPVLHFLILVIPAISLLLHVFLSNAANLVTGLTSLIHRALYLHKKMSKFWSFLWLFNQYLRF